LFGPTRPLCLETRKDEDPSFGRIPVVVLTTSTADIFRGYDLGANPYIGKPVTLGGLVDCMQPIGRYRLETEAAVVTNE